MKAYIIAMTEVPFSASLANDCIAAADANGITASVWPAVNGLAVGAEKLTKYGIGPFLADKKWQRPGVIGCFLSHFELWSECAESNESLCILEHDGFFVRPLPNAATDHFTEILKLDPLSPRNQNYHALVESSKQSAVSYSKLVATADGAAGKFTAGSYGYCVTPAAARKLIEFSQQVGYMPSDMMLGTDLLDIRVVSATVVRLHPFYDSSNLGAGSSTSNLKKFLS